MLCYGQHPQPPSLTSVDLEKLQHSESKFSPQMYLCFSDIAVDNALSPNTISIKLKHSKTDQFKKGVKLVMGRTNDDLCPVTALLPYLIHCGDAPGPLF